MFIFSHCSFSRQFFYHALLRKYGVSRVVTYVLADNYANLKAGSPYLKSIGRVFGKPSSCIFAHIRPSGGIKPPPRRRSPRALSLSEREEISRGLVAGRSLRTIAATLMRSPSTISREISRNGGSLGVCREQNRSDAHGIPGRTSWPV